MLNIFRFLLVSFLLFGAGTQGYVTAQGYLQDYTIRWALTRAHYNTAHPGWDI